MVCLHVRARVCVCVCYRVGAGEGAEGSGAPISRGWTVSSPPLQSSVAFQLCPRQRICPESHCRGFVISWMGAGGRGQGEQVEQCGGPMGGGPFLKPLPTLWPSR